MSRVYAVREIGDNWAFCEACAWRAIYTTSAEAEVAEEMHDLRDCPFRKDNRAKENL